MLLIHLNNFHAICDELARRDDALGDVIKTYGYPPLWSRPNTFESLVHIILEQQVSLASALAALNKLKEKLDEVTAERFLLLSDAELRACYFSRQKTAYVKGLAQSIVSKNIDLDELASLPDEEVRSKLIVLKGIGNWTIDIYLIFCLQRADIFPVGDLAAVNAARRVKNILKEVPKEKILDVVDAWRPYRTVGTMILWHYYLSRTAVR